MDSKFFEVEIFLPEVVRFCSKDTTGELLWTVEVLPSVPELASGVRAREGSDSLPTITASRLLETAALLDEPVDRKKLELDNCTNPRQKTN